MPHLVVCVLALHLQGETDAEHRLDWLMRTDPRAAVTYLNWCHTHITIKCCRIKAQLARERIYLSYVIIMIIILYGIQVYNERDNLLGQAGKDLYASLYRMGFRSL